MKFVYVLEDDSKFQKEIVDSIQSIDPKIQIRLFKQFDLFKTWIKEIEEKDEELIETGGEIPTWITAESLTKEVHQLVAIISKVEFIGVQQMPLLAKLRDQFIQKKICTAEDPTSFVLTAFDEPAFKVTNLRFPILNNVIYKPFDRLILTQHLTYAIDGRHPPSKFAVANQKASALIEMLKDVRLEAMTEVGFITRSDRSLDNKGTVSKYYAPSFVAEKKVSVMATLLDSKPDPANPKEFLCSFSFFGISPTQLSSLRKKMRASKPDYDYNWEAIKKDPNRQGRPLGVVIIDELEENSKVIMETLRRRFTNIRIANYKNLIDFLMDLDPKLVDTQGGKQGIKALPQDKEITFVFEPGGDQILDFVKPSKESLVIMGAKEADWKVGQFWKNALSIDMQVGWKAWIASPGERVIVVRSQGTKFYLRPTSFERDKTTQNISVKFVELNVDQRNHFLVSNSKIPVGTDVVLVSHKFLQPEDQEFWTKVKAALKTRAAKLAPELSPAIMLMVEKDYTDSELRILGGFVSDVLYRPVDRLYLATKIKLFFPEAETPKDEFQYPTFKKTEAISVANPVPISGISEAGIVLQYYRQMSLGSFRGFVLWLPYDPSAPKLIGTCNYTEETQQKGIYNNHFVFFGMTDYFLKALRIWIRENYIMSKEQG